MVEAHELFQGFMRYYNALHISDEESQPTQTTRILSYYDMLGRMLGYRITSELTLKTLVGRVPKTIEKKKIDQIWFTKQNNKTSYELAIESQLVLKWDRIENDVKKLSYIPSNNLLLYCCWDDPEKIFNLAIKDIQRNGKSIDTKFLIIVDPWTSTTYMDEGEFQACLLNYEGEIIGKGYASGNEIEDKDLSLRIISNTKWSYF